jgi:hypothetical protein
MFFLLDILTTQENCKTGQKEKGDVIFSPLVNERQAQAKKEENAKMRVYAHT